jgi:RNA polymerase sigma-32 factor
MVGGGSGALRSKTFFKLRRARVRIANQVGDGAHADELVARALDISVSSLRSMEWSLAARDASLDSEVYANSPTTLGETLPAEGPTQEDRLASAELERLAHAAVFTALPSLDRRERYIVENRLLVVDEDELSLAEIARRLGVSRERARQLEARAKKKLKKQIVESAYGARLHEYSLSGDR